jgi:hypothetical protein
MVGPRPRVLLTPPLLGTNQTKWPSTCLEEEEEEDNDDDDDDGDEYFPTNYP